MATGTLKKIYTPAEVQAQIIRKNLLDNWYFVGGGSQLGDGIFPINTSGNTSYSTTGQCIDRWRQSNGTLNVLADKIQIVSTNSWQGVMQAVNTRASKGDTVTFSLLVDGSASEGTSSILYAGFGYLSGTTRKIVSEKYLTFSATKQLFSFSAVLPDAYNGEPLYTNIWSRYGNQTINLYAAKLELGSYQTLAHNEGTADSPNWVLNELPDWEYQLWICRPIKTPIRENLLDNWYFAGGGSQLGDGVFPINQRGQTSYPGAVFGVDRWYVTNGSSSQVTIDTDGVIFKNTAYTNRFSQHAPISIAGKTVTLSALCTVIDGARYAVTIQTNAGNSTTTLTTDELTSVTFTVPSTATEINAQIRLEDDGASVKIHAMKLELGSYQTLAHEESDGLYTTNWVLNELPDFDEELAKCQRHLVVFKQTVAYRVGALNANGLYFAVPLPQPLAKVPTTVSSIAVSKLPNGALTGFAFEYVLTGSNALRIVATKEAHGLSDASISFTTGAIISAE